MLFFFLQIFVVSLAIISPSLCQYGGGAEGQYQDPYNNYNRPPPPQILSHKQALNHDGNFRYLFTSENGLAQGESIAPDGSRNGGYSYTDPTGRKISVKYTAGKEGFKILEADHLPKAPLPIAPVPGAGLQVPQSPLGAQDDGQYRPELYENNYQRAQPQFLQAASPYAQNRAYQVAPPVPISNNIESKEIEYNDAPGKPYSFGAGYNFEFAG